MTGAATSWDLSYPSYLSYDNESSYGGFSTCPGLILSGSLN